MSEDEISTTPEEVEKSTAELFAEKFREAFPEYPHTLRSKKKNDLLVYGEKGKKGATPFLIFEQTPRGVKIVKGSTRVEIDDTSEESFDKRYLKSKKTNSAYLMRPSSSGETEFVASWGKGEVEDALYYARLFHEGLTVDRKFLDQYASWMSPDVMPDPPGSSKNPEATERPMTFRELIQWQLDRGFVNAKRLPFAVEKPLKARRFEYLSKEEEAKLIHSRIGAQEEPDVFVPGVGLVAKEKATVELQNGTELGKKIIRAQTIQIEAMIALLQSDSFSVADEKLAEVEDSQSDEMLLPLEVPEQIREILDKEAIKIIDPIREEDPETAEFYTRTFLDRSISTYAVLRWLDTTEHPQRVLYPASGANIVPKLAFGEDKVVHTSLEGKRGGDEAYYQRLGEGHRLIADNAELPFKDEAFDVICLLDSPNETLVNQPGAYSRLLKRGGVVVLSNDFQFADVDDRGKDYRLNPDFEEIPVPKEFQKRGESQSEFTVFRKKE